MRDSSGFGAPQSHKLKPVADEIQRIIAMKDFEEAVLNMTGFVALNVVSQGRAIWTRLAAFQVAQLAVLSLLLWRIW